MESGIYEIYNKINGKRYIGSTVNFYRRWIEHKHDLNTNRHHSIKLQRAWEKYGAECFDFRILHYVQPELLLLVEQFYIDSYNFHNDLYNSCRIAGNILGFNHSEETKRKISNSHKGKITSLEARQNMAKAQKGNTNKRGKTSSIETKKNISIAKRRFNEEETLKIKELRALGLSCIQIGKLYNVDRRRIYYYLNL